MSLIIYFLHAVAFLDLLAVGSIVPLVPQHVRKMGGNEIHIGLLGSIYAGFQLVSGPLLGNLSDLKGRKLVMCISLLLSSLAYICLGVTNSIFVVLIVRAVLGIFKQTQMLTRALVPDYENNQHKQAGIYGKMAAISGAGMTLGPVLGGHITEDNPDHGFLFISLVVGFCFAMNACIIYFIPASQRRPLKPKMQGEVETNIITTVFRSVRQSFIELYHIKWSIYWDVFMFKALISFAMGIYYSNYVSYLQTQYSLTPKYIGYVISFQSIVGSISSFFIGYINSFYIHDKDYSIRNFHIFILLSVALIGLISSYSVWVYSFWLIPLAIGNATGRLVTLEMVLKKSQGHAGTLIGASNSVRSLTGVVSPMVSGLIGEYIGAQYPIYASLCSITIGVILSYRHRSKIKGE